MIDFYSIFGYFWNFLDEMPESAEVARNIPFCQWWCKRCFSHDFTGTSYLLPGRHQSSCRGACLEQRARNLVFNALINDEYLT